ncbi:glycoside hydrolase family 13 protein [Bacillus massiliglaciei]|uniref:glycoside hydrolase family 13 protein n=1 Tax=Bacillus massiliglaciei TaxID=1816693 RepID=UPI000AC37CFB|nr:alpha-glucosidase [Bacillus massiliglaciei]
MKRSWWKEAVCYQVYPRSFMDSNGDGIGDLRGLIAKLDYLKDLGVDVIWVCPFYRSPNADNGYDISDYQAVGTEYGTMEDADALIEEIHKRGMRLVLDLVLNHTSDEHPWFIKSRSSRASQKRDWYIWRDGTNGREPNNWESIFSGSAWKYDKESGQYYLHLFAEKQPDLNWHNEEMRKALYQMIRWWLGKGIDGFRIDAITHIKKRDGLPDMPNPYNAEYVPAFEMHTNQLGILSWLQELKAETFSRYDVMTVGEANGVPIHEAESWVGEQAGVFNMIFQFEHLGLWKRGTDQTVDVQSLKHTLTKWQKGLHQRGWNALFLENHDQPRSVSSWGDDKTYWKESAKMIGGLYFLMQGTPFIYQGQEIAMTNVKFPTIEEYDDVGMKNYYQLETANGRAHEEIMEIIWQNGRDNSRTPMQWDAGEQGGFTSGKPWMKINPNYKNINVEQQMQEKDSVYHFYKTMIQVRKKYPVFIYGEYNLLYPDHSNIYVYTRSFQDDTAFVICNFSQTCQHIAIGELNAEKADLLLANYPPAPIPADQSLELRPYEIRVYMN